MAITKVFDGASGNQTSDPIKLDGRVHHFSASLVHTGTTAGTVTVEISPYDLSKGRITFRAK